MAAIAPPSMTGPAARHPLLLSLVWLAACAGGGQAPGFGGPPVAPEEAEGSAPAPAPSTPHRHAGPVSMSEHAKSFRTAPMCEQAARNLRQADRKKAFAFLMACARRPDFVEFELALQEPWLEDVRRFERSGMQLATEILANRGGNVEVDLTLVRERGVQLFDLTTAIENSDVFRGRYVVFRGKVRRLAPKGRTHQLLVVQTTLQAENEKVRWNWVDASRERSKGRNVESVLPYDPTRRESRRELVVGSRNVSFETQRQVVAFLEQPPQDLKEGDERLFLIRYEERTAAPARAEGEAEGEMQTALCALVGHFAPLDGPH
jgi:hypothetical protein